MAKTTKAILESENAVLKEIIKEMRETLVVNGFEDEVNEFNDNYSEFVEREKTMCADTILDGIIENLRSIKDDEDARLIELYNEFFDEDVEYDDVDWDGC